MYHQIDIDDNLEAYHDGGDYHYDWRVIYCPYCSYSARIKWNNKKGESGPAIPIEIENLFDKDAWFEEASTKIGDLRGKAAGSALLNLFPRSAGDPLAEHRVIVGEIPGFFEFRQSSVDITFG